MKLDKKDKEKIKEYVNEYCIDELLGLVEYPNDIETGAEGYKHDVCVEYEVKLIREAIKLAEKSECSICNDELTKENNTLRAGICDLCYSNETNFNENFDED